MSVSKDQQWFVTFENGAHFLAFGESAIAAEEFAITQINSIVQRRADYQLSRIVNVEIATPDLFKKYYGDSALGWGKKK